MSPTKMEAKREKVGMVRLFSCVVAMLTVLYGMTALAADYRYVKTDTFKGWLESGKQVIIVDIQAPEGFAKGHFKGALETNAYPVKSDEEKKRLDATLEKISTTKDDVVIVCPRGGSGAKNTYDYLKSRGVDENRMYILEKGAEGWP
ncbi:Cdc25 family phosphatase [Burkholderiales bacterium]|nr:Cdc25 family phosphatase [Burkholderiales bacterium]